MSYLITQTFSLLLIAGLLGMLLGWYLTRISGRSVRESLKHRLRQAEQERRDLRAERDAAVTARDAVETERRLLSDDLNDFKARQGGDDAEVASLRETLAQCQETLAAAIDPDEHAALKEELNACRDALESAVAPAPTVGDQDVDIAKIAAAAAAAASGAKGLMDTDAEEVARSAAPPLDDGDGPSDDLRQIKGIGPKIAGILDELGIRRFDQIAAWTPENVDWVNERLKFKGRVEREQWIEQAQALVSERSS